MLISNNFIYLSSYFSSPVSSFSTCQINGVSTMKLSHYLKHLLKVDNCCLDVNEMYCTLCRPSSSLSIIRQDVFFSLPEDGDYFATLVKTWPLQTQNLMWSNLFNFICARIPNTIYPNSMTGSRKILLHISREISFWNYPWQNKFRVPKSNSQHIYSFRDIASL